MDIANLIIASLTLIISFVGLLFSLYSAKFSLDITHLNMYKDRSKQFVNFTFTNNSSKSIKIKEIHFFKDNKELPKLDFDPFQYDEIENEKNSAKWENEHSNSDPFSSKIPLMNPYKFRLQLDGEYDFYHHVEFPTIVHNDSDLEISTYLNELPDKLEIIFSRKVIIGFKLLIIPVFTDHLSANLHKNIHNQI
ncbi:MAG: hypothetical protein NC489_31265 [Ruminococcus flavefaciens]|nr:hypothetical protein [Ruminococcus flavefaciens]